MTKIWIDYSDGRYFTRPLTDEEAAKHDALDVVHIEDGTWEAYLRHCDHDATWQVLWRSISNEQSMRRREKALQPLEDAEREISQLKHDLAQAKRMWTHFEESWLRESGRGEHNYHTAEARSYNDYTCIFPMPGCDVEVLPAEWRGRAREILEKYRVDLAAQDFVRQGCCCGHEHKKLDDATTEQLRAAGFLVEHDAEAD